MYTPESNYEYETILHLGCIALLKHFVPMGGQIEYARRYLQKRYGKDPDDERIPLYFLMNNTVTMKQALDLKFWAETGLKYIRSHFEDIESDVKNEMTKVKHNLKQFCKL